MADTPPKTTTTTTTNVTASPPTSSEGDGDDDNAAAPSCDSSSLPGLIPSLPDDLTLQILARLPPSSHPTLSLVSRSFRSLFSLLHHHSQVSSIFSTRHHLLRLSQPFLCISLRSPLRFFYLLLHPNPSPISFAPLPPPPLPTLGSACASHGSLFFLLGGSLRDLPSPTLQILDLRLRRWSLGPSMSTPRHFPAASVFHGRIYVFGGCHPSFLHHNPHPWAESFDPNRPSSGWTPLPEPPSSLCQRWMHGCAAVSDRVLAVADRGGVSYDPSSGEWAPISSALDLGWKGRAAVVGGLVYTYDFLGRIKGYDPEVDRWMEVDGLERKLPRFLAGASMADLGGRLCVVWEGRSSKEVEICFAGIDLERLGEDRLRGVVAWSGSTVLPLPCSSTIAHCMTISL